jgi:hypothetical protein
MDVAALVFWLVTAVGGFVLLGTWVAKGGLRPPEEGGGTRLPPAALFGHFLLAAAGLVVWIAYVASDDSSGLAWTALVILVPVALLGFAMLLRWLGGRRARSADAEQAFPVPVVAAHGALAVTTVVLVLIAAIAS